LKRKLSRSSRGENGGKGRVNPSASL